MDVRLYVFDFSHNLVYASGDVLMVGNVYVV